MKVAVLCEYSGTVRDAFIRQNHDAFSVDIIPSDSDFGPHIQDDIRNVDLVGVDLVIAHPPCTYLAVSGARWFKDRPQQQIEALDFVRWIMALDVPFMAIENPISIISSKIRKPDQIVQPWQFGHGEVKATCLWLKNIPKLQPTNIVSGRDDRIHKLSPSPDRGKLRSKTYDGLAEAMADQWGWFCQRCIEFDRNRGLVET